MQRFNKNKCKRNFFLFGRYLKVLDLYYGNIYWKLRLKKSDLN